MATGFAEEWTDGVKTLRDRVAGSCPGRLGSRMVLVWVLACSLPGLRDRTTVRPSDKTQCSN
jgi:hypothetical protein